MLEYVAGEKLPETALRGLEKFLEDNPEIMQNLKEFKEKEEQEKLKEA